MTRDDLEATMNWLSRCGWLDSITRGLIEDAIYYINNGQSYRAECALRTAYLNNRNDGKEEAAKAIERLL